MTDQFSNIQVIDNFLSKDDFFTLKSHLLSNMFPWYLNDILPKDYESNKNTGIQFTHVFYQNFIINSSEFSTVLPLVNRINPLALIRVKANLLPKSNFNIEEHGYHTDLPPNLKATTSVFYLNTNNGFTKFEDGSLIESVENRLVMFDSRLKHTGSTCTDAEIRCVININYVGW